MQWTLLLVDSVYANLTACRNSFVTPESMLTTFLRSFAGMFRHAQRSKKVELPDDIHVPS